MTFHPISILFSLLLPLGKVGWGLSFPLGEVGRGSSWKDSTFFYTPPAEEMSWARQFDSISGPGHPVVGDGRGGWRSGTGGVQYSGPRPRPEYKIDDNIVNGSAVEKGLVPPITPAVDLHLRDGVVTLGGDGCYYLTGSSGDNIWGYTKGLELWKSADLRSWEYLGLVWDLDRDAPDWARCWRRHPRRGVRAIWAPEIHYVKGNYFICYSMCPYGIGIVKSATGRPEGPYVNALDSDEPLALGIDATLFEDEDGSVYFTYAGASRIARMKDDMSGLAEPLRKVVFECPDTDPRHHAPSCRKRGFADLGHEGAVFFKRGGKYYLGAADTYEGRYSPMVAVADSIYGPYVMRHEAVPCGGGTGFFRDKEGNWWCSCFGNDNYMYFREKVGFIKIDFRDDGRIVPAKDQPFVDPSRRDAWHRAWDENWSAGPRPVPERRGHSIPRPTICAP